MKSIEEVEKERDEILTKALRLIELDALAYEGTAITRKDWEEAAAAIEAHRPKSKPLEWWANIYGPEDYTIYHSQKEAKENADDDEPGSRIAVHMREVLPAPKWERWEGAEIYGDWMGCRTDENAEFFDDLANRFNAEMERLAALWEGGADE